MATDPRPGLGRWARRAVVAAAALVAFGAVAVSIVDGWRPAGGHGVAWIEAIARDDPQAHVGAYLRAVSRGDRERALSVWELPRSGWADVLGDLRERREAVTARLLADPPRDHRVVDVQWWSTCCEPHVVPDRRDASVARIGVVAADDRRYTFDVRVVEPGRSLLDEVARRWAIAEVYPSGEQPTLFRWVSTRDGAVSLGAARPSGVKDCGATAETRSEPYDAGARGCVWAAYSSRAPVRWSVASLTTEGDPVRATLIAQPGYIVLTRDMTADRFSAPADRRLWVWQCRTMTRRPWPSDPARSIFELADCSGDGRTASVP